MTTASGSIPNVEPTSTPSSTKPRWEPVRVVPPLLLAAAVSVFTALWTWFGWLGYESLHLTVYDFGLTYQEIWATAHGQSLLRLGAGAVHPLVLGFVPFLGLFPDQSTFFLFLLSVNSLVIALGAVPLYLLVRDAYRNDWLALGIAGAYLAFPAVAGSLWFPVHLESFFPVLFLTGYWLYRRNSWGWACVAWTFALVTDIGAPVILAVLAAGMLVEPFIARTGWWQRLRGLPKPLVSPIPRRRIGLIAYLLAASAAVFLGISLALIAYDGFHGFISFVLQTNGFPAGSGSPLSWGILGRKALTFLLLFGPLLGLPFLGREERWAMLPFIFHAFLIGNPAPFLWPFKDQYSCYVLPGLFASTVRGLDRPWRLLKPRTEVRRASSSTSKIRWQRLTTPAVRWGWGSVLAVVLVGLVFAPWGPANPTLKTTYGLAQGYYDFPAETTANTTAIQSVQSLISMTPSQGTLLVQNNLVEPLNRFQYVIPGYLTSIEPVSYVLTDPYDITFYEANLFAPHPASMLRWADYYLATGATALGEADGALLLSTNGSGPPLVYQPLRQSFGPSEFACCGTHEFSNVTTATPLISGPTLPVLGNYSVWSPGNFSLVIELTLSNPNPMNQISVALTYERGLLPVSNFTIVGASASPSGALVVTSSLHIPVYLPEMHIELTVVKWIGSVEFDGLWLNQTAPISEEHLGTPWSSPPQPS